MLAPYVNPCSISSGYNQRFLLNWKIPGKVSHAGTTTVKSLTESTSVNVQWLLLAPQSGAQGRGAFTQTFLLDELNEFKVGLVNFENRIKSYSGRNFSSPATKTNIEKSRECRSGDQRCSFWETYTFQEKRLSEMAVAMWWMGSGWDGIGCISHFHTFTFISARRNTLSGRQPSNFQILSLSLSQVHFLSFTFNFTLSLSYQRDATPSLAGNLPI